MAEPRTLSDLIGTSEIQPQQPITDLKEAKNLSDLIQERPAPKQKEEKGLSFSELFSGKERKQGTIVIDNKEYKTGDLPELDLPFELSTRQARMSLGLLTTHSPQAQMQIIQKYYPKIKFGQDSKGNIIMDGRPYGGNISVLNMPGISLQDLTKVGFEVAMFTPAAKLAQAAGAIEAGRGAQIAAQVATGGAAAGATEYGKGKLSETLGGEPATPEEIGTATALGATAELLTPGKELYKKLKQSKQLGKTDEEFAKGQLTQQKTGMDLFPAQKTLDPYALHQQSFLGEMPKGSRIARNALLRQNETVATSVDGFLNQISPLTASADSDIRTVANDIISDAKLARTRQVDPFFKKAYAETKVVNVDHVVNKLQTEIDKYPQGGRIRRLLTRTQSIIANAAEPIEGKNIERLHNAKREIWSEIDRFQQGGKPLDAEIKRKLTDAYGDVVSTLRKESGAYSNAMDKFIEASPEVTKLTKGKIGQIANLQDPQLKKVTGIIFDAGETNPEILNQTKNYINSVNPDAWNAILRTETQKRLRNIDLDITRLTPDNLPSKIHSALFGAGNKRRIFYESLNPEQRLNARFIEDGLERASKGRPGGSQTGIRRIITHKLNGVVNTIHQWFSAPLARLIDTGDARTLDRASSKLAKLMYDPEWTPRLTEIRKMKQPSAQYKAMLQLVNDINSQDTEEQ